MPRIQRKAIIVGDAFDVAFKVRLELATGEVKEWDWVAQSSMPKFMAWFAQGNWNNVVNITVEKI
jgi:hypothetical protein